MPMEINRVADELNHGAESEGDLGETVQNILRIARKARWWVLFGGLAAVVAAMGALRILPNAYTSEATIQIVEQQIPQNVVAPLSTTAVVEKVAAIEREILSRGRLLQILDETGVFAKQKMLSPELAVAELRKFIKIEPIDMTKDGSSFGALRVSFTAETPELAQQVTSKICSFFIERHSETEANRVTATTGLISDQLAGKRKQAVDLDQHIRDFKARSAGELPDERIVNETRLAELRTQLQSTLTGIEHAKQQRVVLQSTISGNLGVRLNRLREERAALLTHFTAKYPSVLKKDEEISELESLIASVQTGSYSVEDLKRANSVDAAIPQVLGQLDANRLETESLAADQKRIETAIAGYQYHLNMTPLHEQQLAGMERELDAMNQEIAGLEKLEQQSGLSADMERRQEGQQFRPLDPASYPLKPSSPPRMKIAFGALAGGLALGFVIAFLLELKNPAFYTEQELRTKFGPPLVLSVPVLPTSAETRKRRLTAGFEWIGATAVVVVVAVIEFYVYKHS